MTTTLHITVGDREQLRDDTLQFVRADDDDELDESGQQAILQFGSYDDLVDVLTPLRLDLLGAIAERDPKSIRETARLVDRDVSDVHSDLKQLEILGLLDFEGGSPGGAMQPIVPFDRIEMQIEYPLVDETHADESPASAD
ncbi:transcriptional regulator [Halobacteriales archaeon QH_10_67_13]|nr:MAG: transcriptional regulator [Halobacteriales archaeon QH_10_67_13]